MGGARVFLIAVMGWAIFFFLYTRNNDFPYFYHTDEPSKASQLLSGHRNFYHPALMLNATDAVSGLLGVPSRAQEMVVVGRHVSAFFAALAVVGLGLVAWKLAGPWAGVLTAVFCGLQTDFYDAAHYMKEDPYWISGMAFTFLAAISYWKKPGIGLAILLGLAAGWSVSGKYIGLISVGIAVLTVLGKMIAVRSRNPLLLLVAVMAGAMLFLAINHQIFTQEKAMTEGIGKEVEALYSEFHQKKTGEKWDRYLELLVKVVPMVGLVLAGGWIVLSFARGRRMILPEWLLYLLPILLGVALTLTPKTSSRYFLPIGLLFLTFAAIGLVQLTHYLRAQPRLPVWLWKVAALALGVGVLFPLAKDYRKGWLAMSRDHRKQLADHIRANIPATATLAADERTAIPASADPRYAGFPDLLPQTFFVTRYTADLGTLDELRARGVSHIVVSNRDANRLANEANFRKEDHGKLPARRKFYQELREQGIVEWSRKLGPNKYLNASLVLYRIQEPSVVVP